MALIDTAIVSILRSDASVTAIASTRSYFFNLPQNTTLPAVIVIKVSGSGELMHDGAGGLGRDTFQITALAENNVDVKNLAKAISNLFNGYRGTVSPFEIQYCEVMNETDLFEPDYGHQVAIDISVAYREIS